MKVSCATLLGVLALACNLSCQSAELQGEAEAVRSAEFLEECEIDLDRYKEKKGPNSLSIRHYDASLPGDDDAGISGDDESAKSKPKGTEFRIKLSNSYGRKIAISDPDGKFPSGGSSQPDVPLLCKPPRVWWTKDYYYIRLIWDPRAEQAYIQLKEQGGSWQQKKAIKSSAGTESGSYEGVHRTRRRVKQDKLKDMAWLVRSGKDVAVEVIEVDAFGRKIAFQVYQY